MRIRLSQPSLVGLGLAWVWAELGNTKCETVFVDSLWQDITEKPFSMGYTFGDFWHEHRHSCQSLLRHSTGNDVRGALKKNVTKSGRSPKGGGEVSAKNKKVHNQNVDFLTSRGRGSGFLGFSQMYM